MTAKIYNAWEYSDKIPMYPPNTRAIDLFKVFVYFTIAVAIIAFWCWLGDVMGIFVNWVIGGML